MSNKQRPTIVFQSMRYEEEIELLSDFLYTSMCEHSLINITLFDKYPKLLNQFSKDSNYTDIYNFCYTYLKEDFDNNLQSIEQKIKNFQNMVTFDIIELLIVIAGKFETYWKNTCITVKVGNVAFCPRWIINNSFYIPSYIENFLEVLLHESCHFVFFQKLLEINPNYSFAKFEYPNLEWILSELLIDIILRNNLFESKTHSTIKAYDEFYQIKINGVNLIDCIKNIYNQQLSFEVKLQKSLSFLSFHKELILNRI